MPTSLPTGALRHRIPVLAATTVALTTVFGLTAALSVQGAQAAPTTAQHRTAAASPASRHHHKTPPKHAVLWGLDDHWESDIKSDDKQDHSKSGIVGTFLAWSRPDMSLHTESRLVIQYAQWARHRGAVPMIDLHPPAGVSDKSIAAGSQDKRLAVYAKALHRWNHPFLFRLFPEMNVPRQTYAPDAFGNTPKQFIAAWRHVVTLFRHYHATNVKFIWNPDKRFVTQKVSYRHMWPGRKYVNWVGVDVFDFNGNGHSYPSAKVATAPSIRAIRKFTKAPLMIPEIGVAQCHKKARWIAHSLKGLSSLGVKAVVWFNEKSDNSDRLSENWRLNSSSAALRATRHLLDGTSAASPGHNHGTRRNIDSLIVHGRW